MNYDSLQGDKEIIKIIKNIGGKIKQINDDFIFTKSETKNIIIDVSQIPDLAPILSILLASSHGTSKIINAGRLKIKESNRLETSFETFRRIFQLI